MLDIIARFIQQRSRLCFTGHKRPILRQRLEQRLTHLDIPDLASYWGYLRISPREELVLLDLLTINETSFFRNPEQFRFLKERIIPELEAERGEEWLRSWGTGMSALPGSKMKLRILCAGCATGEEPYSVAMAVIEALRYPRAWDIEIQACDLSESCIRTAMAGYYDSERLKGIPSIYVDRYMKRCGTGAVARNELKRVIRFSRLNLNDIINGVSLTGFGSGSDLFDVIFCRNVLIYFSAESQQQLVNTLSRLLVPGGYLFTGDAEPLHLYDHDFEAVHEAGCLVYQKMEAKPHAEAV